MNKLTKWCPAPNCKYAVEYVRMTPRDIFCRCGHDFCFSCLRRAHRPIECALLGRWYEKIAGGEDDSSLWIKLNTKPCPKCKI
jgi:ariadne-1